MADNDVRKRGEVTGYRPDDDSVSGGKDKSVQSEARDSKGSEDLANNSATSGGNAGRLEELDEKRQ
jgi:hypothetical protein